MKTFTLAILLLVGFVGCATKTPYDFAQWQGACSKYEKISALHQDCMKEVNQAIQEDLRSRSVSTYESSFFDSESYYQSLEDQRRYKEEHNTLLQPQPDRRFTTTCRTTDQLLGGSTTDCVTNY